MPEVGRPPSSGKEESGKGAGHVSFAHSDRKGAGGRHRRRFAGPGPDRSSRLDAAPEADRTTGWSERIDVSAGCRAAVGIAELPQPIGRTPAYRTVHDRPAGGGAANADPAAPRPVQ